VLVAHRYGWIPPKDEGGDDTTSITWLEVKTARASGLQVLPYLVNPDASWPVKFIEGLQDKNILFHLEGFKAELRQGIAGFFGPDPASLEKTLALDLMRAGEKIKSMKSPTAQQPTQQSATDESVVPVSLYDPLNPPTLIERVRAHLPKRILSIDHGAAGAFIALEFLAEIERRLQIRYGEAKFVLSDYFDLIGGVGTGAVIATNLALGRPVSVAKQMYTSIVSSVMANKSSFLTRLKHAHNYDPMPVTKALRDVYGDTKLHSPEFKTCVLLVATRLDIGQLAYFTNVPRETQEPYETLQVSDLLYGCLSLPTYLPPLEVPLLSGGKALFQSGLVCVGNNPALYLLLHATSSSFAFQWRTGERWLQVFSIGTGQTKAEKLYKDAADIGYVSLVTNVVKIQQEATNELNRLLLEKIASREAPHDDFETIMPFSRQRYEVSLDADTMVGLGLDDLADVDSWATKATEEQLKHSALFSRVGERARGYIQDGDFLRTFDVRRPLRVE
jgi:Patatin-like phospholipase